MWVCPKCGRSFKNVDQSHYCGKPPATIEEYIAAQPEEAQDYLRQINAAIKASIPETKEKISWSMPTYWKGRNLIQFAASKRHIGLYPGPEAVEAFAGRLTEYKTSKKFFRHMKNKMSFLDSGGCGRWMRESAHKGRGKTDSTERVGKYNMKESSYKSYDELPLFLNAATVAKVLGVSAYPRRCGLKYKQWPKRDPIKNYFQLPNEIFLLGLSPGALAVYSYLLCCENRNTYQCWPSYRTIGRAVKMSANTVRKYVCELEERQLISTESTTVTTKAGLKRNGNLLYTIRPIQLALDQFYDQQLAQMSVAAERQRVATALALRSDSVHSS